jgi:hypothetical protein
MHIPSSSAVTFSETYSPGWRLKIRPAHNPRLSPIAIPGHFMANGYANAWDISVDSLPAAYRDPNGNYVGEIYFASQQWYYVGAAISVITLMGCLSYLYVARIRQSRKKITKKEL